MKGVRLIAENNPSFISILNTISKAAGKPEPANLLNLAERFKGFLECITNRKIARIIYLIYLARITTTTYLQQCHNYRSRDPISYHLMKIYDFNLVRICNEKHPEYHLFHEFWRGMHPTTHKSTKLFVATEKMDEVVTLFQDHFESLFPEEQIAKIKKRGQLFTDYMERKKKELAKQDKATERFAKQIIGACAGCQKSFTKSHADSKLIKYIGGKTYCRECWAKKTADGSIIAKYKDDNGHA